MVHETASARPVHPCIAAALDELGEDITKRPGDVFYSGYQAFATDNPVYILGLNPGGSGDPQSPFTVERHINDFRARATPWSKYCDEIWEGAAEPGTWGMQPKVLHMMREVGLDPRTTPASNLIFVRTPTEAHLESEAFALAQACWSVHEAVIESLRVRVIVCFGVTAGTWVRKKIGAYQKIDEFVETNRRGWTSRTHIGQTGLQVITLTHPSRANWCNPDADPSCLVRRAIERV